MEKVILINPCPTRDIITPEIDKRIIEYHNNKDKIGLEKGDQRHEPNNGLLSIGAALIRDQFNVKYIDINAKEVQYFRKFHKYFSKEQIEEIINETSKDADFVLFSCLSPAINNVIAMAKYIKSINPKCIIIIGGIFPTLNLDYCINNGTHIDVIILGEGEDIVPRIINGFRKNHFSEIENMKGISYKKPGSDKFISKPGHNVICNLDSIEYPAFELLQEESKPFVYRVFTARGCSSACSFCAPSFVSGHRLRKVSPEKVVNSILKIKNRFMANTYVLGDLTFLDDEEHGQTILRKIIKEQINLPFWCQTRLDRINKENIDLLQKAGCTQIAVGIESYNDSVLNMINKGTHVDSMVKKLLMIKKKGIQVQGYFIIGLPHETKNNMERTIKFVEYSIRKGYLDLTHISIYVPYPGLPISGNVNIIDKQYNHYHQGVFLDMPPIPVYETKNLDQKTILELWLEFLQRVTETLKKRDENKIQKALMEDPNFENEVILGTQALTIAGEIEEYTKLDPHKKGVFNIVQGMRIKKDSFISKIIHNDEKYIIGDAEIYDKGELISIIKAIDGLVEYILLDADIKTEKSRKLIEIAYKNIKKSKICPYSDMAIWCRSVFLLIQHEIEHIENSTICLFPLNEFSKYLGDMLKKRGTKIIFKDISINNTNNETESEENVLNNKIDIYVNFSFGQQTLDQEFVQKLSKDSIIIDATTEGISKEAYELIRMKEIMILKPEIRPLLSSQMSLIESYETHLTSTKGYFSYKGYNFVSGGVIGKKGDIVIDSIKMPKKIIGIADGQGKIIRPQELSPEDIQKIKEAESIIMENNDN